MEETREVGMRTESCYSGFRHRGVNRRVVVQGDGWGLALVQERVHSRFVRTPCYDRSGVPDPYASCLYVAQSPIGQSPVYSPIRIGPRH